MFTEAVIQEVPGIYVANSTQQVVVVDESPTQISLYQRSIASLAVELNAFRVSDDALVHLRANEADLLFIDLAMTDTDGLTFLRELREKGHFFSEAEKNLLLDKHLEILRSVSLCIRSWWPTVKSS